MNMRMMIIYICHNYVHIISMNKRVSFHNDFQIIRTTALSNNSEYKKYAKILFQSYINKNIGITRHIIIRPIITFTI